MKNVLKMLFLAAPLLAASLWALAPNGVFSAAVTGHATVQVPQMAVAATLLAAPADVRASASQRRWIHGQGVWKYQDCTSHPEHSCGAYALLPEGALPPGPRLRGAEAGRGTVTMASAWRAPPIQPPRI